MARPVYVIYPAALFDGWEVVEEGGASPAIFDTQDEAVHYAELRATLGVGAVVKLENWFGDTERVWEVPAHAVRDSHRP
ncbi:MAG: hypothetical protein ACM36B_10000 [Bacteroidota bacterium]